MIVLDFHGREMELRELNEFYKKDGFKFVVLYGRRRVGKSTIVQKFIDSDNKPNISFMTLEENNKQNLNSFSEAVLAKFPKAKDYLTSFSTWEKAFDYIISSVGSEKLVLFIDEYPYLAKANKAISSILQKYADGFFRKTNIMLVLCGSSMSFMENQVLGGKSPLYGRRDMQFKIEPFDYLTSAKFFPKWSNEDKAVVYGIAGGIPLYLQKMSEYPNIADSVKNNFLKKNGSLFEEPKNLLLQELREPAVYNAIIKTIATGATRSNEIAIKAGEENNKVSKYLITLMSLHIIKKDLPVISSTERNGIYKLSDNMFKFWYKFVPNNNMNIELGMTDYVYDEKILPKLPDYMGHIFEDICIQYMKKQNKARALPFIFDKIGQWWGNNPESKSQEEIDVVATAEKSAIFGECKWTKELVGVELLNDVKRKSAIFNLFEKKYYYLFSKSGFTDNLQKIAKEENNIMLVSLNDIYTIDNNDKSG
jgi:AAA+ ATPase superfamily predicted ATPase